MALKWAGIVIITGVCALLGVSIGGVLGATVGILAGAWAGPGAAVTGILGLFKGSVTGWAIGVATSALVTGTFFGTSAGVSARCRFFKPPPYVDVINKGKAALNQQCLRTCSRSF